ncbi:MAG: hypothetical protein KatS3mg011_1883 [Acidimicrobiia bacterium]|nr:MAG: hypothetical protein KatS3mg011_1883 [Acidimicrobiia bacterium]
MASGVVGRLVPGTRWRVWRLRDRVVGWDPVVWLLLVYGLGMLWVDGFSDVRAGVWGLLGLVLWRVGWSRVADVVGAGRIRRWWVLAREGGSSVLAVWLTLADGFDGWGVSGWLVVVLAWQAARYGFERFVQLAKIGVAAWVVGVLWVWSTAGPHPGHGVEEAMSVLLTAGYVAVLGFGVWQAETLRGDAARGRWLFSEVAARAPVGLVMLASYPLRVVWSNRAAGRLGLVELATSADGPVLRQAYQVAAGGPVPDPLLCEAARGSVSHLRVMVWPLPDPESDENLVMLAATDATDEVAWRAQRSRFFEMASHQLRTPLTPIVAYSRLLSDPSLDPGSTPRSRRRDRRSRPTDGEAVLPDPTDQPTRRRPHTSGGDRPDR